MLTCRQENMEGYRFGFNGMERDDEVKGYGRHLGFGDYGYDPAIAKRINNDPITYPWQSTYSTFNNNPIIYSDPLGLSGTLRHNKQEAKAKAKEIGGIAEKKGRGHWYVDYSGTDYYKKQQEKVEQISTAQPPNYSTNENGDIEGEFENVVVSGGAKHYFADTYEPGWNEQNEKRIEKEKAQYYDHMNNGGSNPYSPWNIPKPHYYTLNLSVSLPITKTGGLIGWNGTVTIDRYHQVYFSPLGGGVAKTGLGKSSFSLTANWILQNNNPTPTEMYDFLSGHAWNAGGGYYLGGCVTYSPSTGKEALGIGLFTPQVGASYNFTPIGLIFNEKNSK